MEGKATDQGAPSYYLLLLQFFFSPFLFSRLFFFSLSLRVLPPPSPPLLPFLPIPRPTFSYLPLLLFFLIRTSLTFLSFLPLHYYLHPPFPFFLAVSYLFLNPWFSFSFNLSSVSHHSSFSQLRYIIATERSAFV